MKNFLRYFLTLIFLSSSLYAPRGESMAEALAEVTKKHHREWEKRGGTDFKEFDYTPLETELVFTIAQKAKNEPDLEAALRDLEAIRHGNIVSFPEDRLSISIRLDTLRKNMHNKELVLSISEDINKDLDTMITFSDGEFKKSVKSIKNVFNEKIKSLTK